MKSKLIFVSGSEADAGEFDDWGEETYRIEGGSHDGHEIVISTEKHNCGAYGESMDCSCGSHWHSEMNGCWQAGHQREESGEHFLEEYEIVR